MWERVFADLSPGLIADAAALDRAAAELGFPLPASYRSFCETCGIGLAGGQFRVAVPSAYDACDLATQAGLIGHSVGSAVRMLEEQSGSHRFDIDGGEAGVIERACFFGAGEDGSFLLWDVAGTAEEYDIWLLAPDLESVRFGGETLADFFTRACGGSAALVLGPGAEPLPARFEGFPETVLARGTGLA